MTEANWTHCGNLHSHSYEHAAAYLNVLYRVSMEMVAARMKEVFDTKLVAITDGSRPSVLANKDHVRVCMCNVSGCYTPQPSSVA